MLPRVLEPEVMDAMDDALEYDAMDHAEVNAIFVADLLEVLGPIATSDPPNGERQWLEAIDLGVGTGDIPIELCRQAPNVRVVGVDMSDAMLTVAMNKIDMASLRDRIRLDRADAKALPYGDGAFQLVFSNSLVHHLAQPREALAEAWRILAPGGWLFLRDLARPDDETSLAQLVERYAGSSSDRQRRLFADSLRAALTLDEIRDLLDDITGADASVSMSSDRHWTAVAKKDLTV